MCIIDEMNNPKNHDKNRYSGSLDNDDYKGFKENRSSTFNKNYIFIFILIIIFIIFFLLMVSLLYGNKYKLYSIFLLIILMIIIYIFILMDKHI